MGSSALAVIKTIPVGSYPLGVAVNAVDDTVYVANSGPDDVSVISGRTPDDSLTVAVGLNPQAVAVNQEDDTVYVANGTSTYVSAFSGRTPAGSFPIAVGYPQSSVAANQIDDTVYVTHPFPTAQVSAINGRTNLFDDSIAVGAWPMGVAVDDSDDTVYVADPYSGHPGPGTTWAIAKSMDDSVPISVGLFPGAVAVKQTDDTTYVTNSSGGNVSVINGRTTQRTDDTIAVGIGPTAVAVDQRDGTVYVTNNASNNVSIIDGRTNLVTATITVGREPRGVAVDDSGANAGLVYVTNWNSSTLSVIGQATPTLNSNSSPAGSSVSISLDVTQVPYDVDDSTIAAVTFGGRAATGLTAGAGDTWTMTVPQGSGTVPVLVTFNGDLQASAGNFTILAPPPPPTFPPSPPGDAAATAGDASATVTWTAPTSPGSFPVTNYQVTSSPGDKSCLTSALTCTVTGLINGTTYTFTVKALSGAGWGASSTPSNAVTPKAPPPPPTPSITITGSRDGQRITVTGTSMHLDAETVRPWIRFPGETTFSQGSAVIPIAADGSFTWSRKSGKKIYVYVAHESDKSNTVVIAAR